MNRVSRIMVAIALPAACWLAGCAGSPPTRASQADRAALADSQEMQSVVMMMADDWIMAMGEAMSVVQSSSQADLRTQLLAATALRNSISSSLDIAVGANPRVAMLDLLVLSALQQWTLAKEWPGYGIPTEVVKQVQQRLFSTRRDMVEKTQKYLSPIQLQELQRLIDAWIAANPHQEVVAFVRLSNFVGDRNRLPQADRELAGGLLQEVAQVTSALDDTRFLGERALWYASRYPLVVGLQAEFTAYRLAINLTKELDAQRDEFFDRVAHERTEIIREFDEHRDSVTQVLGQSRDTMKSAETLSSEISKLVAALDLLAARFDHGNSLAGLTAQDLKDVIRETGVSAEKLTALVSAGDSMLEAKKISNAEIEANQFGVAMVNRILWGGAGIVVLLIAGLALVRLIPQRTR
ncbi:MAG: hypothetical protein K8R92_08550 [Planctomycetes bacterium]|nr:hypothetical protein [Planctomycetota bacterium]